MTTRTNLRAKWLLAEEIVHELLHAPDLPAHMRGDLDRMAERIVAALHPDESDSIVADLAASAVRLGSPVPTWIVRDDSEADMAIGETA